MNRSEILIEADELLTKINNPNLRIFDATIVDDMYLQGHIPGAAYFDHAKFSDSNSPYMCTISPEELLATQIGNAGISNDSEVIVYACGMLPYAVRAWWVLRYAGHNKVRILNGGITAWKNAGGLIETEARHYEPSTFEPHFVPGMFASKEEILASMESEDVAIVNVLMPASYEAKHIPGSINLSCIDLMQGDMMQGMDFFQPDETLALRLESLSQRKRIITYCGGGIAAAVNAAAHLLTGHENVAVYDGSLYEWLAEKMPTVGDGKWEVWLQPQPEATVK